MAEIRPIDANALADKIKRWSKRLNPGFYRSDVLICDALVCVQEYISDSSTLDYVPRQQWISVKDRLPVDGVWVLVYINHDNDKSMIEIDIDKQKNGKWFIFSPTIKSNITHWMPLPEPPKGE